MRDSDGRACYRPWLTRGRAGVPLVSVSAPAPYHLDKGGPVPTKRQFDLVLIMLILWSPAKGLLKMTAARHASTDTGAPRAVAKAAEVIL